MLGLLCGYDDYWRWSCQGIDTEINVRKTLEKLMSEVGEWKFVDGQDFRCLFYKTFNSLINALYFSQFC